jgi:hypothetical protein
VILKNKTLQAVRVPVLAGPQSAERWPCNADDDLPAFDLWRCLDNLCGAVVPPPFLTWRTVILVKVAPPVGVKLQLPRIPSKFRVANRASRIAARSFWPARSMAVIAPFMAS